MKEEGRDPAAAISVPRFFDYSICCSSTRSMTRSTPQPNPIRFLHLGPLLIVIHLTFIYSLVNVISFF